MPRTTSSAPTPRSSPLACRSRWLTACATASSAVLLSGCGGGEAPAGGALAARADEVARLLEAGDECEADSAADALQQAAIAALNAGEIPPERQEELLGAIGDLAERLDCEPPAGATAAEARALAERLR